jgi:hypothetical protein
MGGYYDMHESAVHTTLIFPDQQPVRLAGGWWLVLV